jgi:hypothetical protein
MLLEFDEKVDPGLIKEVVPFAVELRGDGPVISERPRA